MSSTRAKEPYLEISACLKSCFQWELWRAPRTTRWRDELCDSILNERRCNSGVHTWDLPYLKAFEVSWNCWYSFRHSQRNKPKLFIRNDTPTSRRKCESTRPALHGILMSFSLLQFWVRSLVLMSRKFTDSFQKQHPKRDLWWENCIALQNYSLTERKICFQHLTILHLYIPISPDHLFGLFKPFL